MWWYSIDEHARLYQVTPSKCGSQSVIIKKAKWHQSVTIQKSKWYQTDLKIVPQGVPSMFFNFLCECEKKVNMAPFLCKLFVKGVISSFIWFPCDEPLVAPSTKVGELNKYWFWFFSSSLHKFNRRGRLKTDQNSKLYLWTFSYKSIRKDMFTIYWLGESFFVEFFTFSVWSAKISYNYEY